MNKKPYFADSMAFLCRQGCWDDADPDLCLDLLHTTACPPWMKTKAEILPEVEKFRRHLERQGRFKIVEEAQDIEWAEREGKIAVVLGLQHPSIDGGWQELRDHGIRNTQLAYEDGCSIAGGFAEPRRGLNSNVRLIDCDEFLNTGIMIDLSHASSETVRDVLLENKRIVGANSLSPMWISHTGYNGVYNHTRNATRTDMRDVANRANGIVGLYCLSFGLSDTDTSLAPFIAHLKGIDGFLSCYDIVIGTDGIYQTLPDEVYRAHHARLSAALDKKGNFKATWPPEALELNTPRKMEVLCNLIMATDFPSFKDEGKEKVARAICGESLREFFQRVLPKKRL